jgi:serine/threonine protein kinase
MAIGLYFDKRIRPANFAERQAERFNCLYGTSAVLPGNPTLLVPQSRLAEDCDEPVEGRALLEEDSQIGADTASLATCPLRFDGYELLEEIGRGAMGVVFKARQVRLKRIVALKMLLPNMVRREGAIEQLVAEAEVAAQLDHPGIIPVHDAGRHNGQPFICMAFVDGESLEARLRRRPLEFDEAVRIVADLAEAIQHAHDRGIIHRDLKPANILLDRFGRPQIGDFGLAQRLDAEQKCSQVIAGTPSYMSPEQALGQNSQVGPASDVYSLGAVLYHCLTGRAPFEGKTSYAILRQVCETEPASPRSIESSIPKSLSEIARRCLHKDSARRYASAAELACHLQKVDRLQLGRRRQRVTFLKCDRRATPSNKCQRPCRRARAVFWGVFFILLSCLGVGRSREAEDQRPVFSPPQVSSSFRTTDASPRISAMMSTTNNEDGKGGDAHLGAVKSESRRPRPKTRNK